MGINKLALAVAAFVCMAMACGCNGRDAGTTAAFTDTVYAPEYGVGFSITRRPGTHSLLISTLLPWQGADSTSAQHLLLLRGDETVPEDFDGQVLADTAARIVTMSTTQIAMLDAVGADSSIAGVSGLDFVSNTDVRNRLNSNADVGYEGNVNYETLAALNPDIVLLYGVNGPSMMERKLRELDIPYMYVGDYIEESPLGKAEWMVPVAELCGRADSARSAFAGIARRYNALKASVDTTAAAPVVMVNLPYNDVWYMPSTRSYLVRLISDAGGKYIYTDNIGNSSVTIDIERAYLLADSADVWINTGAATTIEELLRTVPGFAGVKPVRTGQIFNCCKRSAGGANDYFESSTVMPDVVLSDLMHIFRGTSCPDSLYYYVQLQ